MAREQLALVREGSFGVPVASPVDGTDRHYVRLEDGNAYQGLMVPDVLITQRGNGVVGPSCFNSDTYNFTGSIQGKLYVEQTDFLMGWGTTYISAARDKPWTTTDTTSVMPPGDLASISAYHNVLEVATWKRRRGSGLKCSTLTLSASRKSPEWTFNAGFVGVRDDTNAAGTVADPLVGEIPDATDAKYKCSPWLFSHMVGGLTIGSARTMFDEVAITFTNTVKPEYFESRYPMMIPCFGRTITVDLSMYRRPTPDDMAAFRALTAQTVTATLNNGSASLALNFGTNCRWTKLDPDKPVDDVYMWKGQITVGADPTTGADFGYVYTPPT